MTEYSYLTSLRYMAWAIIRPKNLLELFPESPPLLYGVIPFLISITLSEIGWICAYASKTYIPISPLPKLLPISHQTYPLLMAILGPFVKGVAVFIFLAVFRGMSWIFPNANIPSRDLGVFYLIVSFSLATLAIVIDQFIFLSGIVGASRFLLSMVHPIVFVLAVAYVVVFVQMRACISLWHSMSLVVPGMVLSGPVLGLLFQ